MVEQNVMVTQPTLQSSQVSTLAAAKFALDSSHLKKQVLPSVWQEQAQEFVEQDQAVVPTCISLDWEDLKCFEAVERQYEKWGVIFHNSLAIQPSNPAFPSYSGLTVLMASPKSGILEAKFLRPVNCVSAFVTSSQRLVLSAYGRDSHLLAQAVLPGANLANSDSTIPPNTLLSVTANDIHTVTFCSFDGQFTVDSFRFCF